jgi:hypothetical protein
MMSDTDDTSLERTGQAATNAEAVPEPRGEQQDDETSEEAADEVDRLEGHSRPVTEPTGPSGIDPE